MQIPKVYFAESNGKYRWFVKEPGKVQESALFDSKEACIVDAKARILKYEAVTLWDIPMSNCEHTQDTHSDSSTMEARYLRARKCQIWGHVCMALGILTIFAGGLILVFIALYLYRKRKKILAEGPVIEVVPSPGDVARRNKRIAIGGCAAVALVAVLAITGSTGSPLETEKFSESEVREKLSGTFYDHGKRIKNPLYGSLSGQIEYQDFSNYTYYISLSPDGAAMTIAESKEGSYGGVNLPGGVAMKNATYTLGRITPKGGSTEVWKISFSDAPLAFPEKEFVICKKGFRSISGVYGDYSFTKKSSQILSTRDEVASFFGIKP